MNVAVGLGDGSDPLNRSVAEPRLVRAAHLFEAQMMKELLQPMTRPSALFEDPDGNETGVLGEFAAESLAGGLSAGVDLELPIELCIRFPIPVIVPKVRR